jgi:hypothetical protein
MLAPPKSCAGDAQGAQKANSEDYASRNHGMSRVPKVIRWRPHSVIGESDEPLAPSSAWGPRSGKLAQK